jgi:hypothetical protein
VLLPIIARYEDEKGRSPLYKELASEVGHTSLGWVSSSVAILDAMGLVKRAGRSGLKGRMRLTEAGRAAL